MSAIAIEAAQRSSRSDKLTLPIVLWQQGTITISQLAKVFDWLAALKS